MSLRGVLPVLALLLPLAAGCVAPAAEVSDAAADLEVSPPRFDYDGLLLERLPLALPDGITLDVAVFRPDVAKAGLPDEKVPILLDAGPYYGNLAGPMDELTGFDERLAEYFIPRGYAVARVSVRGTGMSEGCFGIGDEQERKDLAATVEHLAAQPWSNGKVALIGKSYDGTTPWMAALENPPSLKTIVPVSGISDMYRYTHHDGVAYKETTAFHTYYPLLVDHDLNPFSARYHGAGHLQQNLVRTCADLVWQAKGGNEAYLTGDHGTPYWQARDYEPHMDKIQVPVFLVHGLQDWNVKPDNSVPQFAKLDVPKAMWLGQWEHDYPDINRFEESWSRHDWNETLLVWFDHWLKDAPNRWQEIAHVEVQDTYGRWRTYGAWPPADADRVTLAAGADGTLHPTAAPQGNLPYRDPLALGHTPTEDGTGLTFHTGPLPHDVTILGFPEVDVHLSVDQPGGHVIARLWNVTPSGEWIEIAHGAASLRHRESRDHGTPVPTGAPINVTVRLYPLQAHLPAGNKLGLTLSAEDPHRIRENPLRTTTYTLHTGPDATRLHLTLHAGEGPTLHAAATTPTPPQNQTCQPPCQPHEIIK